MNKPPTRKVRNFGSSRLDGWENAVSGLGVTGLDRRLNTKFRADTGLDPETLRQLYRSNGLGRRVVRIPILNMTRRGFDIFADTDGKVNKYRERIQADAMVRKLLIDARLFGGAIMVLGIDDGQDLEEPLDETSIRTVDFLRTYHRWRLSWTTADLYQDPENPKYGLPEWYTVQPITQIGGGVFRVHETRTIRAEGEDVDDFTRLQNWTWGDSVLQAPYDALRSAASVYSGSEVVIDDFVQTVFSVKGLSEALASGNKAILKDRMDFADQTRSLLNAIFIDSEETYQKHPTTISGLPDLLDRFGAWLASQADIPVSILMGKNKGGLNDNADNELTLWYDALASKQQEEVRPVDDRLNRLVFLAKDGGFGGKEPEGWKTDYRPLFQPTEDQVATTRLKVAQRDKIYVDMGALDAVREVRPARFGGDRYSAEMTLDPDLDLLEENAEAEAQEAQRQADLVKLKTGAPSPAEDPADTTGQEGPDPEPRNPKKDARDFGGYAQVQELRFDARGFTDDAAVRSWCARSNYLVRRLDRTPEGYTVKLRSRDAFRRSTLKITKLTDHVTAFGGALR